MNSATRKARRAAVTREAILDAAADVFARLGFSAATMKDIAEGAGYSAPSLYSYFAGKVQIVAALAERLRRESSTVLEAPRVEGLGFRGQLERLLGRLGEHFERHRALLVLLNDAHGAGALPAGLGTRQPAWFRQQLRQLADWMRDASTVAERNGRDPEQLAFAFWGICHAFRVRAVILGDADGSRANETEAILELFFHGALGPARAQGERVPGGRGAAKRPRGRAAR